MTPKELYARTLEFTRRRKAAYQLAFKGAGGHRVLVDLAKFCRAAESTFHPTQNERIHAYLEGRRSVWLRIQQHLNLSPEEMMVLFNAAVLNQTGDENG